MDETNAQVLGGLSPGVPRRAIPEDLARAVMLDADQMCCVCRVPQADVQIHHIDSDRSNNERSNLAVLCLRHHSEAHTRGGFGRRLTAEHIRHHRDTWEAAVRHRRSAAPDVRSAGPRDPVVASESLLELLRRILVIDFCWEGPFRGEFGEFTALEGEEQFQLPGRESLKTKPRLFHTYWGLLGSRDLGLEQFPRHALVATQRIVDRFADRSWVETVVHDYGATPAEGVRCVRSVRHTAKAASILLLTGLDNQLAAHLLWTLVDAADGFVNADGGCREEMLEQPSSVYASAYLLQLLASTLANPEAPRFIPEYGRWAEAAGELVEGLRRYMAASWRSTRWAYGSAPWEINAPYIAVDVAAWLPPALRQEVGAAFRDELTPTGRLKAGNAGDVFQTPEAISALRMAYALMCMSELREPDHRLAALRAWLLQQDWGRARLRPCDVTFLVRLAGFTAGCGRGEGGCSDD